MLPKEEDHLESDDEDDETDKDGDDGMGDDGDIDTDGEYRMDEGGYI